MSPNSVVAFGPTHAGGDAYLRQYSFQYRSMNAMDSIISLRNRVRTYS